MKIAIVGTSKLSEIEKLDVIQICIVLLTRYGEDTILVSGGASGVDSVAEQVAKDLYKDTLTCRPAGYATKDYMQRNEQIAERCDMLYCITTKTKTKKCYHHKVPQDHEKTAGCWTLREAKRLNKPVHLIII